MNDYEREVHSFLQVVDGIPGWLSPSEQRTLLQLPSLVDGVGEGAIVEIGSFMGKSTVALGLGSSRLSAKKRRVYAIDPFLPSWNPFERFWENVQKSGMEHFIIPIKKYSTEAYDDVPGSIALLFVDGDHSYDMVKHDINHYAPKVLQGGFIAFHDYNGEGVARAVHELCFNEQFERVGLYDTLLVMRKL